MYSMISFSIAACRSLRAPSCSNRSKNGFSSSSARLLSEITLFTDIGASFLLASSGEAAGFLLITERMRLFLSPHTQLSVIPLAPDETRTSPSLSAVLCLETLPTAQRQLDRCAVLSMKQVEDETKETAEKQFVQYQAHRTKMPPSPL